MKFNLKSFSSVKESDKLNEVKLQKEHKEPHNSVTEKQLDRDRIEEKNTLTENQLDSKRINESSKIVEKRLNDSKSKLVSHRNEKTHKGDINKLEEQRLSRSKMEDEKYNDASTTNSKKRWWEELKNTASSSKKIVSAQVDELAFDEEDRWKRVKDAWEEEEETKTPNIPIENQLVEEIGGEPLRVDEIRPVESPIAKGLYIVLDVTPEGKIMDSESLKEKAFDIVTTGNYSYLSSTDFSPNSFRVVGDQLVARLVGDEYYPSSNKSIDEGSVENPFVVEDIQETEVDGVIIGSLSVRSDYIDIVNDMDDSEIKRQVMDAISENDSSLMVEEDGIDINSISSGTIRFVGQSPTSSRGAELDEQIDEPLMASNDFEIVVLGQSKKK